MSSLSFYVIILHGLLKDLNIYVFVLQNSVIFFYGYALVIFSLTSATQKWHVNNVLVFSTLVVPETSLNAFS